MKKLIPVFTILICMQGFAQSAAENKVLKLSGQIFKWEVNNQIDSLENVFDEKMVVVNGSGESQTKKQYIALLRSGAFKHDSIVVSENNAMVKDNTATVVGKGAFTVTRSGNKMTVRLSYIEVFTRPNPGSSWKILAMHASLLQP